MQSHKVVVSHWKKNGLALIYQRGIGLRHMGFKVRFFGITGLVTQLLERREERQLERFFKQLDRLDLLMLDELGYVPFSKLGAELCSLRSSVEPTNAPASW